MSTDPDAEGESNVESGAARESPPGDAPEEREAERDAAATTEETRSASAETTRPDTEGLLAVRDLDAGYGDLQVLDEVDLDVADGEYVVIVGPNGAGKSTVMKSVFGLTSFMGGAIEFDGTDIAGMVPEDIIHYGLGYVPQNENVFAGLSVRENLEMGAYILDEFPDDKLAEVFERFPILEERQEQKAGTLSGGQRQMLAMGRALMLDPKLLMLDEPSAGLAPDLVDEMFDRIDGINESGTAILMVEQNAKEALRRCDRGYVLVNGSNRFEDDGDVLLHDEEVRQEFLGG
ncbi:ABC transporter ATP-binding protein [Halomarina oriensis]|uniref:ATP-binding cassette domain-containing protein n=1 Tax=Halomarina oriensis TaxID=671145 RepID=A0A6B0GVC5_9EURY|nr:ABC transporter ATP-binding protein [Halomarina oriensis]MWG36085.1 ATP-binding cassette domain-containing protein [Halomarina oriensis]